MNFHGYTCPECDAFHEQVRGHSTEDGISIKCRVCGNVDRIRQGSAVSGVKS